MTLNYGQVFGPTALTGKVVDDNFNTFFTRPIEYHHVSKTADQAIWLQTDEVGTSVLPAYSDDADGRFSVHATDTSAGSDISIQMNGSGFFVTTGRKLYFESRLKFSSVAMTKAYVGMALPDATPFAGAPAAYLGFSLTTDADLETYSYGSAGATANTGVDLVADTFVTLAFRWDGTDTVRYYADGVMVGTVNTSTNIPTADYLSPIIGVDSAASLADSFTVDYVLASNEM